MNVFVSKKEGNKSKVYLATFSKTSIQSKFFRTTFKNNSLLFSQTKFYLGTQIWQTIFLSLFSLKALCNYVQYKNAQPVLDVSNCSLEHYTKNT